MVSGERADSPLAPRGSVFRCLQQSSLRRRTQVPPSPVPSSAHLSRAPLLYRRGLPQVTSVFHVATSRGHPSVPIFLSFQSHSLPLKTVFSLDLGDAPGSTWPASCTLTDFSAFGLEPLFFSLRPSSRGGLVQPRGVYARDSRALRSPGALCPAAWLTLGWLSSPQLRHDRCKTRLLATPWPHTHKPEHLTRRRAPSPTRVPMSGIWEASVVFPWARSPSLSEPCRGNGTFRATSGHSPHFSSCRPPPSWSKPPPSPPWLRPRPLRFVPARPSVPCPAPLLDVVTRSTLRRTFSK